MPKRHSIRTCPLSSSELPRKGGDASSHSFCVLLVIRSMLMSCLILQTISITRSLGHFVAILRCNGPVFHPTDFRMPKKGPRCGDLQ